MAEHTPMKFRKKPVEVHATQFWVLGDHPDVVADERSPTGYAMHTLENQTYKHEVTPGDWIITGVKGETYPCKPDIFEATYEPALGADASTEGAE